MAQNILNVTALSKSFGNRILMSGITFGLDSGSKIGLIGDNGTGKSTLLKILAGKEPHEGGHVAIRTGTRLEYLEQVPHFTPGTRVRDILAMPFAEVIATIAAYNDALITGDAKADALLHKIDDLGGWDWEHKLEHAAQELSISDLDADVSTLSGGYQKRVALARMWLMNADLLLLDEPTNHLDAYTVDWLEDWLVQTNAAAILVTHDRYFLENVVNRMAELRNGQMRTYEGNYSQYLEARAIEEENQETVRDKRLSLLKSELEWARRSPKARSTKSKSRLDRIEVNKAMIKSLASTKTVVTMDFEQTHRFGNVILEFDKVNKRFVDDKPLIKDFSWSLRAGERYGLVGPNGVGKTTFLRLACGEIQPDSGKIVIGKNTQMAYFDQHRVTVDTSKTVRDNVAEKGAEIVISQTGPVHVNSWLSRFGFRPENYNMSAAMLSGGERNRLAMAQFLLQKANVLLLDEPTNDLDLLTLNVLEESLINFTGCVLMVSHDRYFLDKVCTGVIGFDPQREISIALGSYTDFAQAQKLTRAAERKTVKVAPAPAPAKKDVVKKSMTQGEQKELQILESTIAETEQIIRHLEAQLADPKAWASGTSRGVEIQKELTAVKLKLETLMSRWEELASR
jgi:ABC transport system ATP-binding/permease protein